MGQIISEARTALDDPSAVLGGLWCPADQHDFAVARIDEVLNRISPAEPDFENVASGLELLGKEMKTLAGEIDARSDEVPAEHELWSALSDVDFGLDYIDSAISVLRKLAKVES